MNGAEFWKECKAFDNAVGEALNQATGDELQDCIDIVNYAYQKFPYWTPYIEWCVKETVIRWWKSAHEKGDDT